MTETHVPDPGTAPPSIFTPDEPVDALWVKAYQGEVLGEILFARIAEQLDDQGRRHKMDMLSTLERRTKEAIAPALERAGIPTDPDPETVQLAEALGKDTAQLPWDEIMASFEPITTQYAAMYARIGELVPGEQAMADLLVAHELALREFGRRELSGRTDESLRAIEALPHMQ